jgi:oxygen-independent coproporphyrinogen III oxidase
MLISEATQVSLSPFYKRADNPGLEWAGIAKKSFKETIGQRGISLYVHLPFCERLCTFCSYKPHITINHKVETVYIDKLIREWQLYLKLFGGKPLVKQIYFGGGTPTFFSPENLEKLISFIKQNAIVPPNAELTIEANVAGTTVSHLITLHKAGFKAIRLGIQDFDWKVQEEIKRRQDPLKVQHITALARSIGFEAIHYELLYGLPHQSRKTMISSIYKIKELMPERITLMKYQHEPKVSPGQKSFEMHLPVPEETLKLAEIGREMLMDAGYTEIGMGTYVLKKDPLYKAFHTKSIHRNQMGYTRFNTGLTVGIGAGAVGDTWNAIASNIKNIRDYYQCIDKGDLPVQAVREMSSEELLLRNHFYNLQCHLQTSWNGEEKSVVQKAEKRLRGYPFQNLIKFTESGLKVKKAGRQYIQAICCALNDVMATSGQTDKLMHPNGSI